MIASRWLRTGDGVDVGLRSCGERGDAVIFVHGVGSTAAIWDEQLKALGERFRCFAVELRGNGAAENDPSPEVVTRAGFAQDVLTAADGASLQRFHFVGCSLGGVVGFELWRRAPERVASFVLVDTFAAYPNAQQTVETIISGVSAAADMREFARGRAARVLPPDAPAERLTETIDQMACKSVPCYIASTKATWTGDYRGDLATITVPTLVVCGELDPIAPVAFSQEIAQGIPGARCVVIPAASHVCSADEPRAFNTVLARFLDDTRRAAIDVEAAAP